MDRYQFLDVEHIFFGHLHRGQKVKVIEKPVAAIFWITGTLTWWVGALFLCVHCADICFLSNVLFCIRFEHIFQIVQSGMEELHVYYQRKCTFKYCLKHQKHFILPIPILINWPMSDICTISFHLLDFRPCFKYQSGAKFLII